MNNQIVLTPQRHSGFVREDFAADVTITPGELIEPAGNDDWQPHGTAGDFGLPVFALEQVGVEPASGTKQIDHDYQAGDLLRALFAKPGAEIYAWLTTIDVARGDPLESDGAGALQAQGTGTAPNHVVAYAAEDVSNAGGGSRTRIKVYAA